MGIQTLRLKIEGRVQGVWFRGWAVQTATALKLSGWVRNRRDGSVDILVSGEDDAVETMVIACRKGPPAAVVTKLSTQPAPPPAGPGFNALPTA